LNSGQKTLVSELTELVREGRARVLGVVRQELLSGIRTLTQYEHLRETLRSFPDERVETSDYELAAKYNNECRSKGIAVSVVDGLICAMSSTRGWPIFTTDPDFRNYANVLPIRLHLPRK
jgi:predicted nucleic acid-binding protein